MRTIIANLLLLFFILINIASYSQIEVDFPEKSEHDEKLYGKWKMLKIIKEGEVITPIKKNYFVTFNEKGMYFKLEVNSCGFNYKTADNKITIVKGGFGCTRVCCDGRNDKFCLNLKYTGTYVLKKDTLIINNDKGIHYLIKEKIENK